MLNSHPAVVGGPESDMFRRLHVLPRLGMSAWRWRWHLFRCWDQPFRQWSEHFGISAAEQRQLWRRTGNPAGFVRAFFGTYAERHGATRWVDKTPANVKCVERIFATLPDAKFVHLIRDGRDVCCSVAQWWRQFHPGKPLGVAEAAEVWARWVRLGRAWRAHPRCCEVRYEDLVSDPEPTLRRLLAFLELDWDDAILRRESDRPQNRPELGAPHNVGVDRPVYRNAMGRWQRDLTAVDRAVIEAEAGDLLRELGYAGDTKWVDSDPPSDDAEAASTPAIALSAT